MKIIIKNGEYKPTQEFFEWYKMDKEAAKLKLYRLGIKWLKKGEKDFVLVGESGEYTLDETTQSQTITTPSISELGSLSEETSSLLFPYQVEEVKKAIYGLNKNKSVLLAHGMGLGKTAMALAICKELGEKALIIAPKSTHGGWHKLMRKFDVNYTVTNIEQVKFGHISCIQRVGEKDFDCTHEGIIVFDEVHICGDPNGKSLNSKILMACRQNTKTKIIVMSATVADKPEKLFAVGYCLGLHNGSKQDFKRFQLSIGGSIKIDRFSNAPKFVYRDIGKTVNKIRGMLYPYYKAVRKTAEDVTEIPDNLLIVEFAELNGDTQKVNAEFEKLQARLEELKSMENDAEAKGFALAAKTRALQSIELIKLNWLLEQVVDAVEEGMSPCVFLSFKESVSAFCNMLEKEGIKYGSLTGETKAEVRARAIEDFQADRTRVFVMTTAAGGAGVNLHDVNGRYPRISFIMPNENSTLIKQASGRAGGRAGGKTKTITKFVFVKDTYEEGIGLNMERKLHFIDMLNDGDVEMKFAFTKNLLKTA